MMALEFPQYYAGQSVELYQCVVWPLYQREEVLEYCHCPVVRGVNLVLGTERR